MSQATELLDSLIEPVIRYSNGNSGALIIIGDDRFITVPDELKRIAVQYDHDVETVTFYCPRYWDDLDMSKMSIFINYRLSDDTTGSYIAQNIEVADDVMYFDWTISKNVTKIPGQISFLVCVRKTDDDGNLKNHWNSELCTDMYVSEGLETIEDFVKVEKDLVTQLLTRMGVVEQINIQADRMEEILEETEYVLGETVAAKNAAVAAQNAAKGFVDTAKTSYANALKGSATGSIIRVDDVSPVEHVVKCRAHGKNLIDVTKIPVQTSGKIYISAVGEGYVDITTTDGYISNGHIQSYTKLKTLCPQMKVGHTYVMYAATQSILKMAHLRDQDMFIDFGKPFTVTETMLNSYLAFYGFDTRNNQTSGTCRVSNIQIEEGTVATEYEPYINPSSVTLKKFGRNILRFTDSFEKEMYGVKVTYDRDKDEFTINGTPTTLGFSITFTSNTEKTYIRKGDRYTITLEHISGSMSAVSDTNVFYTGTSDVIDGTYGNWNPVQYVNSGKTSNTRTANNDFLVRSWVYISPHDTVTFNNYKFRVQLEVGETSSAHDSTQAESYSVGTDGSIDIPSVGPTMTLMTDTKGVTIDCEYNRDTNVVIGELIARINELEKG